MHVLCILLMVHVHVCLRVCVSGETGRESACVSEWNIDGGGRCVWGSARCSVTVDNHSLIYLSKTLSSHTAPAKQFLLSLPPSSPSLPFSPSLPPSNYNLEGYFSPGQKHSPQALPLLSDSPFALPFSLLFLSTLTRSFPLLRVGEWKWTSCKHTPLIAVYAVVYLLAKAGGVKAVVHGARGVGYLSIQTDRQTWNKDAPRVERGFDQCTAGDFLHSSALEFQLLKCA